MHTNSCFGGFYLLFCFGISLFVLAMIIIHLGQKGIWVRVIKWEFGKPFKTVFICLRNLR